MRIPVVTGIGHEDDYTIADMVADLRGLTPTDAASKGRAGSKERLQWLGDLEGRLRGGLLRRLEQARAFASANWPAGRCFRAPLERRPRRGTALGELHERLERAMRQRIHQDRQRVAAAAARLDSLSPLNVLARGYSLTLTEKEVLVRRADQAEPVDRLTVVVQDGQIVAESRNTSTRRLAATRMAGRCKREKLAMNQGGY